MPDFLLELRSEEIPARMQERARPDLARLFADELGRAGLAAAAIETFATPRRLALIARDLPAETAAVREELKGPRSSAPPQALEGFLRKTGLTREQLEERDGVFFAVIDRAGRPAAAVLAEAVAAIVRAFPWPKSMRWGAASLSTESLRWVRPLHGIVALFGEDVVDFEIDGIRSGAATVGHRFRHPGPITIGSAADYADKLRMCHVIVDQDARCRLIAEGARAAAAAAGLRLIEDDGLLIENAGLTEWPVPLLGRFDPAFLQVPREVIQLTMRTNQKYFACVDGEGQLAPAFVCVANIDAADGGAAIVRGNEKVLAARLADATFFWEQDLKVPLEAQAKKLDQIVFHEKLGTVADKVDRVAKLARWLVEEGIIKSSPSSLGEELSLAALAETAARLCKADLVTGMVGEFPELQGVMGGHYARAQGLPDAVADAIRDHYKPVGQGDDVPTAPVTVAVSLADKLDTLFGFFLIGERPTGSKDPFALRRSALGVIFLLQKYRLRLPIISALEIWSEYPIIGLQEAYERFMESFDGEHGWDAFFCEPMSPGQNVRHATSLLGFFADRLKVQQREAGVRHDLIDAVFALGGEDDLVRLLARVRALQVFVETAEGRDLLAGYKRAANILKKENYAAPPPMADDQGIPQTGEEDPLVLVDDPQLADVVASFVPARAAAYDPEPAEAALIDALDAAGPRAEAAVAAEDFEGAMAALASLRAPVDAFFEAVTVNDPDPARRAARLALLARVRDAVHRVADFSKIEG
jgi:glycyl-tRNA synthetase beta chain